MTPRKIFLASDHAGFALKDYLLKKCSHYPWEDLGPFRGDMSVDYPDFAQKLTEALKASVENFSSVGKESEQVFGVLICKSGQGMCMKANRYSHIRAALGWSIEATRLSREHNNANVLCIGSQFIEPGLCEEILKCFFETDFLKQHHKKRVEKLSKTIK